MSSDLSQMIYELMSDEMGDMGPHIVKKQCRDIQVNPDDIIKEDLPRVAKVLSEVMVTFGKEEARKIYMAINKLQNLETIVEDEKDDKKKMEGFLDLGDFARFSGDYDKAWEYYSKLLDLSQKNQDTALISKANCMLGLLLNEMNEPHKAIDYFENALNHSIETDDKPALALTYRGLGYSNWRIGNYPESLRLYNLAIEHSQDSGNDDLTGIIYIDIGLVNDTQGKGDDALRNFNKAIQILKITDNEYNLARAYNNVGEVFKNKNELDKAIRSYDMCYQIASSVNYTRMMGYALGNSAECLAKMGDVLEARKKADQTMDIFTQYDDKYMISGVHLTYGIIHSKDGNKPEMDKSFGAAIEMLESMNYPYEIGTNTYQYGQALKEMVYPDEAMSKFKSAYGIFTELGSEKFIMAIEKELLNL